MIKINDVTYRYSTDSDEYSIKNLNLHIQKGEFVVLCGRSGCGKTTVTRLINGLIPHLYEGETIGDVHIDGKNVKEIELSDLASTCGSVFQSPKSQFFNTDTTGELAFGCENLNFTKEETGKRLEKTVKHFSLEALMDRDIFKLSGGEKQQIACGSIYATDPEIYVLDEPSSNMDAGAIMRFKGMLSKLKKEGKTIVISEHRLYFLMELADRFLYFEEGELKETYTPEQLYQFTQEELATHGFRTTDLEKIKVHDFQGKSDNKSLPSESESASLQASEISGEKGENKLAPSESEISPLEASEITVHEHEHKDMISFANISCVRNGESVLDIESLSLPTESIIAIIGENGAGKSTFAEVMTGLLKSKGSFTFYKEHVKPKHRTEKSYMVMQDVNRQLFSDSVLNEISLGAKEENLEQITSLMEEMDIAEFAKRHPASLSGGQKQRVAICAAVLAGKEVMIYDEPTSGLDYKGMKNLCDLIIAQKDKHLITMIITHDMELVLGCCTHVLHLSEGKVKDFYEINEDGILKLHEFFIHKNKEIEN